MVSQRRDRAGGPMILTDGRVVTPSRTLDPGWIRIVDGVITDVGSGSRPSGTADDAVEFDVGGCWVGPGFIDLHIHGGGGHEIMDGADTAVPGLATFLARHGVTSFLPTTYTASHDDTIKALEAIAARVGPIEHGATVLGAHMEGPYISHRHRGAHRDQFIRGADWDELEAILALDVVRLMVVAPEVPENAGLIRALRARGVAVAAGHTDATFADLVAAADDGVTLVTHVFNGMRAVHHREPGAAVGALMLDAVSCEVIADGVHVDPVMLNLVWRQKGRRGIVLVSDAGKAAGLGDGVYQRAGRTMVVKDGVMRLPDGTISSSVTTLDAGFRTFCAVNDLAFDAGWDVASRNAAEVIGVSDRKGTVQPGKDADLTILDDDGQVVATIVGGRVVHQSW